MLRTVPRRGHGAASRTVLLLLLLLLGVVTLGGSLFMRHRGVLRPSDAPRRPVYQFPVQGSPVPVPSSGGLRWAARDIYLPASQAAIDGFARYEAKQTGRDPSLVASWKAFAVPPSACLDRVPECAFFMAIKLDTLFSKCCAEHTKLQAAFNYTMDAAEASGLQLFLDSGTLLSAVRDGEMTLVPWETDIDLGVVGVEPSIVAKPLAEWRKRQGPSQRRHLYVSCLTKVSKNASRNGRCRDAHYVYYANTSAEAQRDSSRVEIWPFWPEPGLLVHPTRAKLSVAPDIVLPLRRCRFWGRLCWCPRDAVAYLNHEYGADGSWRRPKTIHWGKDNVPAVRKAQESRRGL